MTTNDRLDEIQARADQATDGPWESDRHVRGDGHVVIGDGLRRAHLPGTVPGHAENAEFIAHARTDVPRLVAALRAVLAVDTDGVRQKYGLAVEGGAVLALSKVHAAIEAALVEADQ